MHHELQPLGSYRINIANMFYHIDEYKLRGQWIYIAPQWCSTTSPDRCFGEQLVRSYSAIVIYYI